MSSLLIKTTNILFKNGGKLMSRITPAQNICVRGLKSRPPAIEKIYQGMESLEHNIDQEAKPGANLPFSIENPRALAFKMILFIGIAFNIPFYIIYRQLKAKSGG